MSRHRRQFAWHLSARNASISAFVYALLTSYDEAADSLARLLEHPDTAFVHARFPVYGCFALRIDRA